jgi:hypothetical protein
MLALSHYFNALLSNLKSYPRRAMTMLYNELTAAFLRRVLNAAAW